MNTLQKIASVLISVALVVAYPLSCYAESDNGELELPNVGKPSEGVVNDRADDPDDYPPGSTGNDIRPSVPETEPDFMEPAIPNTDEGDRNPPEPVPEPEPEPKLVEGPKDDPEVEPEVSAGWDSEDSNALRNIYAIIKNMSGTRRSFSSSPMGINDGYFWYEQGSLAYNISRIHSELLNIKAKFDTLNTTLNGIWSHTNTIQTYIGNTGTNGTIVYYLYQIYVNTFNINTKAATISTNLAGLYDWFSTINSNINLIYNYIPTISSNVKNLADNVYGLYSWFKAINDNIIRLDDWLKPLNNNVASIYTSLGTVNKTLNDINSALNHDGKSVAYYAYRIYSQIQQITDSQSHIETSLKDIYGRIGTTQSDIFGKLSSIDSSLTTIKTQLTDIYKRIGSTSGDIYNQLRHNDKSIALLVSELFETVTGIATDTSVMRKSLNDIYTRIGTTQSDIFTKLSSIDTTLAQIKTQHTDLYKQMTTTQGDIYAKLSEILTAIKGLSLGYDDSRIIDYLDRILNKDLELDVPELSIDLSGITSKLDRIIDLLTTNKAIDIADALIGDLEGLGDSLNDLLSGLQEQLETKFPFCIPAVISEILGLVVSSGQLPVINFEIWGAGLNVDFNEQGYLVYGIGNITSWIARITLIVLLLANTKKFVYGWSKADA